MNYGICIISILLFLLCWFFVIKKLVGNKFAAVRTVKAEVCDKYINKPVSRYPGTFSREHYMVVFATADNKKLSFEVSQFSYGSYKKREKGTLKYQGSRLISFK